MLMWLAQWLQGLSPDLGFLRVFQYLTLRAVLGAVTALLIGLFAGPRVIRRLTELKIGQPIRTNGMETHHVKSGTPTMGGVLILMSIALSTLLWADLSNRVVWIVLIVTLGFGAIGWADDWRKVVYKDPNGMRSREKYLWQSIIGLLAALYLVFSISESSNLKVLELFVSWVRSGFDVNLPPKAGLLLLDEPTNHLDLDALVWLESWLKRYPGTLLVISHDREFLDAITQVTVHVEHAQLARYSGNYTAFEEQRAERIVLQQAAYTRQQEKIAHLQQFIDRFKAKATKAKQAQSRVKALERMEKLAPVLTSADFTFEFQEPPQLPNPMLAVRDAAFGYRGAAHITPAEVDSELQDFSTSQQLHQHQLHSGEALPPITGQDKVILQGIHLSVLAGQRIGVLGANGQGKSTFVKTIAHALPLLAGRITEGKGLRLGYFAQQELDVLQLDDHPLGHMTRLAREHPDLAAQAGREQDLRNFLGSFQFAGDMVHQAVGSMSGGEKARLVLAMLVWQRPNLLLLDEPTNHLDLVTREALAMALNSFEGTVMLVSHDRALLRAVCDDFWLVGEGGIRPFDGDLDDYQRYLQEVARQRREQLNAGNSSATADADSKPALSGAEQRKLQAARRQQYLEQRRPLAKRQQQLEKDIDKLRADKERLEAELCQPLEPQAIADAGRQLKQVTDGLDEAEMEWLEVSEQLEALEAAQQET